MGLRVVPVDDGHRANIAAVRETAGDHTILAIGVAGTAEFSRIDPIPELTAVAHGAGTLMHVDAAQDGFTLLFIDHEWSLVHAPVDPMTINPRRYGQAVVLVGGLLFRDKSVVNSLAVDMSYLESASQASLAEARSGAGVASAAVAMRGFWPDGYHDVYERQQANADWLYDELRARGYNAAESKLPSVAASVPDEQFSSPRDLGWRIS